VTVYRLNVDLIGRAHHATVYRYRHTRDPRVCLYRGIPSEKEEFHVSCVYNSSLARTVKRIVDNPEAPRQCGDCSLQPSPPAALSNCTPLPPTPPPLGTLIAARDMVADRNGRRHLPSARRRRCTCQRSCRHPCSAGPNLCGPRLRDRGEVSEDHQGMKRAVRHAHCALKVGPERARTWEKKTRVVVY